MFESGERAGNKSGKDSQNKIKFLIFLLLDLKLSLRYYFSTIINFGLFICIPEIN